MHGVVRQNQHDQEHFDGAEVRPHDLREQLLVPGREVPGLFPVVDQAFQIVDQHGDQHVDTSFSRRYCSQRFVWISIDQSQLICNQHRLAEDQGRHRHLPRRVGRDPVPSSIKTRINATRWSTTKRKSSVGAAL